MKTKAMLLAAALVLSLFGCAGGAEPSADALARAAVASQPEDSGLEERTGEERTLYLALYGLTEEDYTDAAVYAAQGMDGREIAVIRAARGQGDLVAQAMESYRKERRASFAGYLPQQEALLENARVIRLGDYAALLACDAPDAAQGAIQAAWKGEGELETLEPSPSPTVDVSGYCPMDAPGFFDMTPYDTGPILAAWESGEESGLSEKDAAILARCREAVETCVTEGMTDFQKEVALHEWLMEHTDYDYSVYEPGTERGREGNNDPYGTLVDRRGICLGFASSFQLLLDMAGVECRTVVGASGGLKGESEDHAWNLVKLEGEWYGVDPTWNFSSRNKGYRYFNVTSDFLRETDHQWDYQNVPEAEGERFHWDRKSELPE